MTFCNFADRSFTKTGVTCKIKIAAAGFDHKPAPQSCISIKHSSSGKMLRGNRMNRDNIIEIDFLPPVDFYRVHAVRLQKFLDSKRSNDFWRGFFEKPF